MDIHVDAQNNKGKFGSALFARCSFRGELSVGIFLARPPAAVKFSDHCHFSHFFRRCAFFYASAGKRGDSHRYVSDLIHGFLTPSPDTPSTFIPLLLYTGITVFVRKRRRVFLGGDSIAALGFCVKHVSLGCLCPTEEEEKKKEKEEEVDAGALRVVIQPGEGEKNI